MAAWTTSALSIITGSSTLRAAGVAKHHRQIVTKRLKVDGLAEHLQLFTEIAQPLQSVIKVGEAGQPAALPVEADPV
ncbi:hypothetical protein [Pleomorphomonas oryzae]|uniref:hypothetical protein n=1 Tax=Pleomorphomonas oryzae TaxID=261934 RepID=UPI0012EC9BDC|nr:hypothetical protein [Pleomorphomonas oryzae]